MKRVFRGVLFCPLNRGKSGEAGKGEASAASQSAECLSCPMTQKGKPVTLTLQALPQSGNPQPSARRAVKLKNPWARKGPSILRTFPYTTLLHNLPPSGGHNPRGEAPSTFPSEPFEPFEPSEPSRRRRVHGQSPVNPHTAGVSTGEAPSTLTPQACP